MLNACIKNISRFLNQSLWVLFSMHDDNFLSMVKNRSFPLHTNRNLLTMHETKNIQQSWFNFKKGDNGI